MELENIEDTLASDHAKEQKAAADSEYDSLMANESGNQLNCHRIVRLLAVQVHIQDQIYKKEQSKGQLVAKGYAPK